MIKKPFVAGDTIGSGFIGLTEKIKYKYPGHDFTVRVYDSNLSGGVCISHILWVDCGGSMAWQNC